MKAKCFWNKRRTYAVVGMAFDCHRRLLVGVRNNFFDKLQAKKQSKTF